MPLLNVPAADIPRANGLRWALLAIAIASLVAALLIGGAAYQRRTLMRSLDSMLGALADERSAILASGPDQLRRDVKFLSEIPPVTGIARADANNGFDPVERTDRALWLRRLHAIFTAYAEVNPDVVQVRYIGAADGGLEIARLDNDRAQYAIASPARLRRTASPQLLARAGRLKAGEVFIAQVSGADGTDGRVRSLILQGLTPVFGPDGRLFGMIVIDRNAQPRLERIGTSLPRYVRLDLLDSGGAYLLSTGTQPPTSAATPRRRWQDDFKATDATGPLTDYVGAGGIWHGLRQQTRLNLKDPAEHLTLVLLVPDQIITDRVRLLFFQIGGTAAISLLIAGSVLLLSRRERRYRQSSLALQAQLAALVGSTSDAIIGKTLDGMVTSWNPGAERMFGYSAQEAIGRQLAELILPNGDDVAGHGIATGDTAQRYDARRRRKDGSELDVAVSVAPIHAPDGTIRGAAKTVRDISNRKAVENALRNAQARLEMNTRAAGIGLWDWDIVRNVITYDDTSLEIFGLEPGRYRGERRSTLAPLHPDDTPRMRAMAQQAAATLSSLAGDFRILRADGEMRILSVRATAIAGADGKACRMLGINVDVTDDRNRERQLAELNETLEQQVIARTAELQNLSSLQRAILTHSGNAIIATDLAGTITLFNPAAEQMLGYTSDEACGHSGSVFILDEAEIVARAAALTNELGRPIEPGLETFVAKTGRESVDTREWTYIAKDGTRFPVLLTASSLRDETGTIFGFLGIAVDLRQSREQERTIRDNARFLKAVTDNIPGMIGYWDRDLHCRFANKALLERVKRSEADMLGVHIRDALGEKMFEECGAHFAGVLAGEGQIFERTTVRPDGSMNHILTQYIPDSDGTDVKGYYAVVNDVSDLKQAQIELEKLNAALAARTRDAEAANVAKSQFLANMSHEIRTPMNAILGMLLLLLRTELSAGQRGYAANAYSATRSLLRLLNDILDFSKIEAGKIELEKATFSPERIMRDLSPLLSVEVDDKRVELIYILDDKIPRHLLGDAHRLRQILLNLAANAIKFTPDGEIVISMAMAASKANRTDIEFAVRDTGIGIAPENLDRIFEGFRQGEASTTRRFGGTGLGLAICERLIELMGGKLQVDSKPGAGSRFHFRLSFEHAAETDEPPEYPDRQLARDRRFNVLIIDDHAMARNSQRSMVESLGWHCDTAESGREALDILRDHSGKISYDIIFVDWKMPEMDGFEFVRRFNAQNADGPSPIIIMLTGQRQDDIALQAGEPLIDGILIKPITTSMLLNAVADVTTGRATASLPDVREEQGARLSGLRLLVVDDNAMNRTLARDLLAAEGALIDVAASGIVAVEMAIAADPVYDAVLMDIQMPEMDGYQAAQAIRQHARLGSMPIVAMTANVMSADPSTCAALGIEGYVSKPIDLDELVAAIRQHCRTGAAPKRRAKISGRPAPAVPIDIDMAVRRLDGNELALLDFVDGYLADAPTMTAMLCSHLREGRPAEASPLLHSIKGLAATVGAMRLSELARDIEAQIVTGAPASGLQQSAAAFERLAEETNEALRSAAEAMRARRATTQEAAGSAEGRKDTACTNDEIRSILDELEPLLRGANMRALDLVADVAIDRSTASGRAMAALADAVKRMDFTAAQALCSSVRDTL